MSMQYFLSKKKPNSGFSLVELTVGLGLTLVLGAFAYRAFSSHATSQMTETTIQRFDKQTIKALETIKKDLEAMDYNWVTMGVVPFSWAYPTAYDISEERKVEPSTWLLPDENYRTLIALDQDITTVDELVGTPFAVVPTPDTEHLQVGDYVFMVTNNNAFHGMLAAKTVNASSEITSLTLSEVPFAQMFQINEHGFIGFVNKNGAMKVTQQKLPGETEKGMFLADSTFIQKVNSVTYCLGIQGGNPNDPSRPCFSHFGQVFSYEDQEDIYLIRMENGPKRGEPQFLAHATQLDFDFDMRSADGDEEAVVDVDVPTHQRTGTGSYTTKDVVAVRVSFESEVAGRNRDYSIKVMLAGAESEQRYDAGGAKIADAGGFDAAVLVGAPQVEHYPDGSRLIYTTQVGFQNTAYDPLVKSAVRATNVDNNTEVTVITLPKLGDTKLLGHTLITLGDDVASSPGMLMGGYREDLTGDRKATLMVLSRYTNKKVKAASTDHFIRELGYPDGGSTEAGLQDTAYIADIDGNIYIASFTKDSGDAPLKIFRTKWNNTVVNGFDPVETEYSNSTTAIDRQMTSIGPGPTINGQKHLAFCESTSTWGGSDGRVMIAPVQTDGSLGSAIHIVDTDWDCRGVHTDKVGNMMIGGRLSVKTVTATYVNEILSGNLSPILLNLDDRYTQVMDGVPTGVGPYYSEYQVGSGMDPIKWVMGSSLTPIDEMNSELAVTNIAGFLNGSGTNDLSVTSIRNEGRYANLVATTEHDLGNPNATEVSVVFAGGKQDAPSWKFPPGEYPAIDWGDPDFTPTEVCPKPLFSAAAPEWNWYACFARTWRVHPEPPDPTEPLIFAITPF